MRKHHLLPAVAIAMLVVGSAQAEQWDDAILWNETNVRAPFAAFDSDPHDIAQTPTTNLTVYARAVSCGAGNSLPALTAPDVPIVGGVGSPLIFGPSNCLGAGIINIDLNQFARQSDFLGLQTQVAAINSQLSLLLKMNAQVQKDVWIGSALAASLVNVTPQDGNSNRLGINVATVQGQSAFSVNYAHVSGPLDFNAGMSFSASNSRYATARVGIGFSW